MEQVNLPNADEQIKQLSTNRLGHEKYPAQRIIEPISVAAFYGCLCHKESDVPALDSSPTGVYDPEGSPLPNRRHS